MKELSKKELASIKGGGSIGFQVLSSYASTFFGEGFVNGFIDGISEEEKDCTCDDS